MGFMMSKTEFTLLRRLSLILKRQIIRKRTIINNILNRKTRILKISTEKMRYLLILKRIPQPKQLMMKAIFILKKKNMKMVMDSGEPIVKK